MHAHRLSSEVAHLSRACRFHEGTPSGSPGSNYPRRQSVGDPFGDFIMRQHKSLRRQVAGQGMTEYIIVVALIAVAAIGVYTAFGDVVRARTAAAVRRRLRSGRGAG